MAEIAYLRPHCSQAGAERLLADVERAVSAGAGLGDGRAVMRELTADLRRNHARLQSAIAQLKALGASDDPETSRRIRLGEEICLDLLGRLGPLLQRADQLNVLLATRSSDTALSVVH